MSLSEGVECSICGADKYSIVVLHHTDGTHSVRCDKCRKIKTARLKTEKEACEAWNKLNSN